MQNQPSLDINIHRYGLILKPIPMNVILGKKLSYGIPHESSFEEGKKYSDGYLVYLKHRIGRGIRIFYSKENSPQLQIHLILPADKEEIEEVFALAKRISEASLCKLFVKTQRTSVKEFAGLMDAYQQWNLKILHTMASNVLNRENARIFFRCVKHELVISDKEAEDFWSGTDTKKFGDWMDRLQRMDAVFVKQDILQYKEEPEKYHGLFTIYNDENTLLPFKPILPAGIYDFEKGKPKINIEGWSVGFTDKKTNQTLGVMEYSIFEDLIDEKQKAYYDGARYLLKAMDSETMIAFLKKKNESKGDAS